MKKICLFLLLSGVILLGCFGCGKKSAPINVEKTDLKSDFNGVYKNGDITLKVHAKTKNELIYFAETDEGSASGYLELNGSEAKYDFFDEVITFKMDGKNLIISNNRDNALLTSGTYIRESDYSVDDLYTEHYGDLKLIDNKYNGLFTNNDDYIYTYQKSDNQIGVFAFVTNGSTNCNFTLKKDNSASCDIFDTKYEITFDGNKITYEVIDSEDSSNNYKGTFKKERSFTKEEIIGTFDYN